MRRVLWATAWVGLSCLGGAAACGGESARHGAERNDAGEGNGGDAGSGNRAGMAGKGGQAGKGGEPGTGGTGGRVPLCEQEVSAFSCEGARFFVHDPATGECSVRMFACTDNDNRFPTLDDCLAACPGSHAAATACTHAYDCEIVDATCCSACEPVDVSSKTAVNRAHRDEWLATRPCPDSCQDCAPRDELELTGKYLVPSCYYGCEVHSVPSRSCTVDSDCFLRDGAGCCEPCDGVGIVALSSLDYLVDLCDPAVDCAACESQIPSDLSAVCSEGFCEVARR